MPGSRRWRSVRPRRANSALARLPQRYRLPLLHFSPGAALREDSIASLTSFARSLGRSVPRPGAKSVVGLRIPANREPAGSPRSRPGGELFEWHLGRLRTSGLHDACRETRVGAVQEDDRRLSSLDSVLRRHEETTRCLARELTEPLVDVEKNGHRPSSTERPMDRPRSNDRSASTRGEARRKATNSAHVRAAGATSTAPRPASGPLRAREASTLSSAGSSAPCGQSGLRRNRSR